MGRHVLCRSFKIVGEDVDPGTGMIIGGMFDSPLGGLLSRLEYEDLFGVGAPEQVAAYCAKLLTLFPATAVLARPLNEFASLALGKGIDGGVIILIKVIIDEFKYHDQKHDQKFEELKALMEKLERFAANPSGALLLRQAAGATQRTADLSKIRRIGRILANGAVSWPAEQQQRELKAQQIAEFTRIAEILIDTDILVLKAIYRVQSPLIQRYREVIEKEPESPQETQLQDQWIQAVFQTWKETIFTYEEHPLTFFAIHSALVRLASQGLIGSTMSQTVVAQVTSTPYGLLELGAQFVESAVNLSVNDRH